MSGQGAADAAGEPTGDGHQCGRATPAASEQTGDPPCPGALDLMIVDVYTASYRPRPVG